MTFLVEARMAYGRFQHQHMLMRDWGDGGSMARQRYEETKKRPQKDGNTKQDSSLPVRVEKNRGKNGGKPKV